MRELPKPYVCAGSSLPSHHEPQRQTGGGSDPERSHHSELQVEHADGSKDGESQRSQVEATQYGYVEREGASLYGTELSETGRAG
jgi:hypothetical protein